METLDSHLIAQFRCDHCGERWDLIVRHEADLVCYSCRWCRKTGCVRYTTIIRGAE
jgi:hypothetical protein